MPVVSTLAGTGRFAPENVARRSAVALLSGAGMSFVIMRCFRTAHPASAWPNRVQAVGRAIGLEGGEGALVRDALFAAR